MKTPAIAAMLMLSAAAQAYEAGDVVVRLGAATVAPDVSSSLVSVNGTPVADSGVDVNDNTQFGVTGSYFLTDKIALSVLAATPFQHNISLTGALAGLNDSAGNLARTKHLPPTVTVQFYPMPSESKFQPYVGLGANYTMFFEDDISGGSGLAGTSLKLDDSFSYAGELGLDYRLTDQFAINAGVWYIDIDTTAEITGAVNATVDVEIDPMVYMLGFSVKL